MLHTRIRILTLIGATTLLLLLAPFAATTALVQAHTLGHSTAQVTVIATGLNNPRGLRFGSDGNLYVAEGGLGGTRSTTCTMYAGPRCWSIYRWLHLSHLQDQFEWDSHHRH